MFGDHRPGITNVWDEFQAKRAEYGFAREIINADDGPLGVKILQQGLGSLRGAIGTPEQVVDLVQRYEDAGVDQVIFVQQAGTNQHEHICESLELFGKKVLPHFADGREEREAAKRERLAEACERALARRAPARTADPSYVITPPRRARGRAGDRRRASRAVERSAANGGRARPAGHDRTAPEGGRRVGVRRVRPQAQRRSARADARVGPRPAHHVQGHGARVRPREGERIHRARSSTS